MAEIDIVFRVRETPGTGHAVNDRPLEAIEEGAQLLGDRIHQAIQQTFTDQAKITLIGYVNGRRV